MHKQHVLKLYKTILRLHRALPPEMRSLGDQYTKDEFRRHKGIAPEHVAPFMMEWANYAATLAKQIGLKGPKTSTTLGQHLDLSRLEDFEDQQIHQLYELRKAIVVEDEAQNAGNSGTTSQKDKKS